MGIEVVPEWMAGLEDEDVSFIRNFLLASGSLKEIAQLYGVTYPTVRLRLDRLIQKIRISEDSQSEPYIALIKRLAVNEKLDFDTAKLLIGAYRKQKGGYKMNVIRFHIIIPAGITVLVSVFVLEFVLARFCRSRWPGLILPLLSLGGSLLVSLFLILNIMATSVLDAVVRIFLILLIANIPTGLLLLIYFLCRRKFGNKKQVEKMNIQDL